MGPLWQICFSADQFLFIMLDASRLGLRTPDLLKEVVDHSLLSEHTFYTAWAVM
jgi:hypothetical protein